MQGVTDTNLHAEMAAGEVPAGAGTVPTGCRLRGRFAGGATTGGEVTVIAMTTTGRAVAVAIGATRTADETMSTEGRLMAVSSCERLEAVLSQDVTPAAGAETMALPLEGADRGDGTAATSAGTGRESRALGAKSRSECWAAEPDPRLKALVLAEACGRSHLRNPTAHHRSRSHRWHRTSQQQAFGPPELSAILC